jgi:hypothetical protein
MLTAPRKKADDRLENRSWPAVSYIYPIKSKDQFTNRAGVRISEIMAQGMDRTQRTDLNKYRI